MRKLQQTILAIMIMSSSIMFSHPVSAEAFLTGNAGFLSDYIFLGIPQSSGTGNGGVDFEWGGLYLGTWIADVETGLEYDLYGGYVHEFDNGFYLGAGGTSFQYSDRFDNEYNEVNFYAGWSDGTWSFDLEYTNGDYNGDFLNDEGAIDGDNYDFIAVTAGWKGLYLTYGEYGDDAEDQFGKYYEIGYGFEVGEFEIVAAIVDTDLDRDPAGLISDGHAVSDGDETEAYISIHRSFDIMKWGGSS